MCSCVAGCGYRRRRVAVVRKSASLKACGTLATKSTPLQLHGESKHIFAEDALLRLVQITARAFQLHGQIKAYLDGHRKSDGSFRQGHLSAGFGDVFQRHHRHRISNRVGFQRRRRRQDANTSLTNASSDMGANDP